MIAALCYGVFIVAGALAVRSIARDIQSLF